METQETETVSKMDFYVNTVALTLVGWVRVSVGFIIGLF